MLKEFIEHIQKTTQPLITTVNGSTFRITDDGNVKEILPTIFHPDTLDLNSLDALVTMVRTEASEMDAPLYIAVPDCKTVRCFGQSRDYDERCFRQVYYEAHATDVPGWEAKTALGFEEAQIALRTRFQETPDTLYAMKLVSDISLGAKVIYNDIGTRFSGGEINYIITGALNTPGAYSLTSETPGEIGNGFYGTLLPIDFVDGLAGAELEDILIPGKDTESDDSLRERYFNSYDNQAFGGNQSDYKERVSALAGVGGVKVFRTPSGGGTVGLTIVDSEWSVPSSTLIASVQNAVDPLTDQGSGIGFAPIGHTVTVSGVTGRTINTKFKLTLENNVSWPDVQAAVTAAIRGYFQSLIKLWADSEAITVRISQIETRVLAVPGVLDVENTTLNAVGANIQLTGTEIPVLGEVSNGTA